MSLTRWQSVQSMQSRQSVQLTRVARLARAASSLPQYSMLARLPFPPFFKGDYEAQFKFVDDNLKWDNPSYDLYDPGMLHQITQELDEMGGKFCILTDQVWEDREPVIKYHVGRKVPHFC